MKTIQYTYSVVKVDEAARVMEVVYTAAGRQTMHIGARLPYAGESLEAVAEMYAPVAYWLEQEAQLAYVEVGASGTLGVQPPVTLESSKAQKLAEIANWRYIRECAGVYANGVSFATDRTSRLQMVSTYIAMSDTAGEVVEWKAAAGNWVTLTKAGLLETIKAVEGHVQQAFNDEQNLAAQVLSAQTIDEVNAIALP